MTDLAKKFELHIPVETDEGNAVDLLVVACDLSKQRIKQAMKNGSVWLTHDEHTSRLRRAKRLLKKGDELHFYFDETIQAEVSKTPELIADEGNYSVFFKPQGMYSQGSKWGDQCTINRWVEQEMDRPAFVVHRLDRAASGLMLIAHTKTAAAALSKLFEERQIEKRYRARVTGLFEPATVVLDNDIEGRKAKSLVTLLEYDQANDCSLLEINIETGRKHQIRRHLSEAGYPIIGDRLYGKSDKETQESEESQQPDLQLVATELSFVAPDTSKRSKPVKPKENIWKTSNTKELDISEQAELNPDAASDTAATKNYSVPNRLLAPELCKPAAKESSDRIWPGQ